jgi:hypothetical protein
MECTPLDQQPSSYSSANDRREYFRVDDAVLLQYKIIDQNTAIQHQVPSEFSENIGYTLIRELKQLDHENSSLLRTLAENNRELELYLKYLNSKIDLVANGLADSLKPANQEEPQPVSVSEGGIAFRATEALPKDTCLALQISFISSHITLVLFAKVIHCNNSAGQDFFTAATAFVGLSNSDRQTLSKHIMQVQLAQKRGEKRQQKD